MTNLPLDATFYGKFLQDYLVDYRRDHIGACIKFGLVAEMVLALASLEDRRAISDRMRSSLPGMGDKMFEDSWDYLEFIGALAPQKPEKKDKNDSR